MRQCNARAKSNIRFLNRTLITVLYVNQSGETVFRKSFFFLINKKTKVGVMLLALNCVSKRLLTFVSYIRRYRKLHIISKIKSHQTSASERRIVIYLYSLQPSEML